MVPVLPQLPRKLREVLLNKVGEAIAVIIKAATVKAVRCILTLFF